MKQYVMLTALIMGSLIYGDQIKTLDGSIINGLVTGISDEEMTIATTFGGDITIPMSEVASIQTEDPLTVRLESGDTSTGSVNTSESGEISVQGSSSTLNATKDDIRLAWLPGEEDPDIVAMRRNWSYRASFDVVGRSGNTDEFTARIGAEAVLEGPHDTLRFNVRHETSEDDGETTARETKIGARYTNFFSEKFGWYTRLELENDEFEDLDLRALYSAGISYKIFDREKHYLHSTTGLAYVYSDFSTGENEQGAGIDLGLTHHYEFDELIILENSLEYIGSVDDLGSFRIEHDSWIQIPISGGGRWNVRSGITNTYVSDPEPDNEELDTLFYSSVVLTWD